ncbi:MAG: hypothetical protein J3K34DRAFT_382705 [Monoraphidium minutum]|nr:MAG: hypothetical protein J3K34DRAFT_382705 [Monoraphidium minutum]
MTETVVRNSRGSRRSSSRAEGSGKHRSRRPRRSGCACTAETMWLTAILAFSAWFVWANISMVGLSPEHLAVFRGRDVSDGLLLDARIPRTSAVAVVESATWFWGACGGLHPMYPPSVCGSTYCLRSASRPGRSVDLHSRLFTLVTDAALDKMCEKPAAGQLGARRGNAATIEVSFVLTFHGPESGVRTVQCMAELLRTAREAAAVEFVLVDDGSDGPVPPVDAAARVLADHFGVRVSRVRNAESRGYGQANNAGVAKAAGKYVVLMNNDAYVTRGWLRALLETAKGEKRLGLVGPFFVNSSGLVMEAGGGVWATGDAGNVGRRREPVHWLMYRRNVDYVSAACILMERTTFLEVGGFSAAYGRGYWEDTDLAMTLAAAGRAVVYQPGAVVVHNEGGSLSAEKEALMAKNQAFFKAKWAARLAAEHCPRDVPLDGIMARLSGQYRLLWVDDLVPEVDRDSGSVRTFNMAVILMALGFKVDFQATATGYRESRYEMAARFAGINVLPRRSTPEELDLRRPGGQPGCYYDVILVARSYVYTKFADAIQKACHGVPVIFDTVDVGFLREARMAMTGSERWRFTDLPSVTAWLRNASQLAAAGGAPSPQAAGALAAMKRDLDLMRRPAVTVVVSSFEADLLRSLSQGTRVAVVSNVHDARLTGAKPEGCAGRRGILFVGNLNHLPNQQAIRALVDDVLPAAWGLLSAAEREDFALHIVGSNAAVEADLARSRFSIKFHGWLPDGELRALYRSVRLVVAPLMAGAGVKGKVNQAMLYGVPVVVTPVAAEGMFLEDGVNALIAATPAEFASKMMAAYRDCGLWGRLVAGGYANVGAYFSVPAATRAIAAMMAGLGFVVPVPHGAVQCKHPV